ncbi:hypothetical protein M404DRAFT_27148 [Pisolithus tinctorius Marx 270]|uniref:Uncharacterized protein n=1 Tax=Pisolithus tinctorius Marx 270 TaxID=870435 RepID=A0A0C3K1X0_PISTI|nr:hypothetical protein M404DRAFT_27148 [Pisolithus tinctorius Marx 270]
MHLSAYPYHILPHRTHPLVVGDSLLQDNPELRGTEPLQALLKLLGLFLQLEPTARDSAVASRRSLRHTAKHTKLENLRLHFRNLNLSEDSDIFCPVSSITPDHVQLPADIPWVLPAITPPDISADQISVASDHLDLTAPDSPGGFIHSTP